MALSQFQQESECVHKRSVQKENFICVWVSEKRLIIILEVFTSLLYIKH